MKQQRISGKEAARVAEDMAKPGPIRVVAASEAQEAPGALVPSPGSELDRKMPPRRAFRDLASLLQNLVSQRGKAVEVRHVHIHSGGQGVVGIINPPDDREGDG